MASESRNAFLHETLGTIAEWIASDTSWHSGILLQVWMPKRHDELSSKGLPYAVIGGACATRDILTLFRGISVRYTFSLSDESHLGLVGRTFRDHEPFLCPNIQELSEQTYLRVHEARNCELEQMVLIPLFHGSGPDFEPFGVLEMTGFMASFQPIALHVPQLLIAHGLSTCNLETLETVTGISHIITSPILSSFDCGWGWGDREDKSSTATEGSRDAFSPPTPAPEPPGGPSEPPGGLISGFAGKRLLAAAQSLRSYSKDAIKIATGSNRSEGSNRSAIGRMGSLRAERSVGNMIGKEKVAGSERLMGSHERSSVSEHAIKAGLTPATPASLAISLCNSLLLGEEIDMKTVLEVRSALMSGIGSSAYEPVNPISMIDTNLMGMDTEVSNALRQMLTRTMTARYSLDNIFGSQSSQSSDLMSLQKLREEEADFINSQDYCSESGLMGLFRRGSVDLSATQDLPERGGKKFWRMSTGLSLSPQDQGSTLLSSTLKQALDEDHSGTSSLDPDKSLRTARSYPSSHSPIFSPNKTVSQPDFAFRPANVPQSGPQSSGLTCTPSLVTLMLKSPSEELSTILSHVDDWTFDSFELDRVACGKPLSCLSFFLFKKMGLIDKLRLNEVKLSRWLQRIEEGYSSSPYHNKIHAADVLRTYHVVLNRGQVLQTLEGAATHDSVVPREVRLLCCYFAAIVHDYEHPGLTNDFMIKSQSKLALMYNDASPLENHHLAASFSLLRQDPYAFLPPSDKKTQLGSILRRDVIQLVMSTDMKQHFSVLGVFSSMTSNKNPSHGASQDDGGEEMSWDNDAQLVALKMALKVSDLGHLANEEATHHMWVSRLEQEMFSQGDKEKALNLPISPLMDRTKEGVTKSQIYFFNVVAIPLFTQLAHVFPGTKEILDNLLLNFDRWTEVESNKI